MSCSIPVLKKINLYKMYIISEIKISFSKVSLCHSAAKIWGEEVHSGHPLSLKDPYVYIRYFLSEIHNHQRCPLFIFLFPLFLNLHDFFRPWTVFKCTQVTIIHVVFWYLLIIAYLLFHFRNKFVSQSIIIFFFWNRKDKFTWTLLEKYS